MEQEDRFVLLLHEDWNELHRLKEILDNSGEYTFTTECHQEIGRGLDCLQKKPVEVVFLSYKLAQTAPFAPARNPQTKFIVIVSPQEYLLLVHMKSPGRDNVLIAGEYDHTHVANVLQAKGIMPEVSTRIDSQHVLMSNLSVPVSITSNHYPTCEFTFVNKAMERLSGFAPEELLGKPYTKLFGQKLKEKELEKLQIALQEKSSWQGEVLCTKKNGEKFWNFITLDPVYDENNQFLHFTWMHHDITKDKSDKKKLEARNQELNTFMYRSSHDMRGPLNSNIGLLSLMKQETENDNFRYYLDLMEQSLTKLNENLLELVELTKIRQGAANVQEVNLYEVINNVASHYTNRPELENFSLTVDVPANLIINSDKTLIRAILQNLIENGIKYRDQNKGLCTVTVSAYAAEKGIGLAVADNGIGIPDKLQRKVFDMFFRANTQTEGSGLGLYIVKNCLEKLHGTCSLTSEEGVGTNFELFLPDLEFARTEPDFEYA